MFNANKKSLTCDLIDVVKEYDLFYMVQNYIYGSNPVDKKIWKILVKDSVQINEQKKWEEGLQLKNIVRFRNVQPDLHCNIIYHVMSRHISKKKKFMRIIHMLSLPEEFDNEMMCDLCGSILVDPVEHVLMRCTQLNSIRDVFWDDLLNMFGVEFESDLFNRSDNDIIEIFLGKHWNCPQNVNVDAFLCKVAEMLDICLKHLKI